MRNSNRLNAKFVEQASIPGVYRDGAGLLLRVESRSAKRWVLRLAVKGRRRDIGIGSALDVSLRDARDVAHDLRKAVRQGADPVAKRRADRDGALTFEAAAEKVHAQRLKAWRSAKHGDQWITTLRTSANPILGKIPVGDVQSGDVLKVLSPIWLAKPETARRIRQRIATVLTWAVAAGHRPPTLVNAAEACKPGLPRQPRSIQHHAAVPWPQVPDFVASVRTCDSGEAVRMALEFLLLTAARTGEVIGANWQEINLEEATWTVPAERMKAKRPHRVPLSDQALRLLQDARARWPQAEYLFPCHDGRGPLSNMAMLMLMRRLKRTEVPHGLRSSFRDWCADTGKSRDLAEAALAHTLPSKTEAAYQRSDLFEARRRLMAEWADFVTASPND